MPPHAIKFDVAPPLTSLLVEAKNAFEKADIIVVVGFSFAEADLYITRMLSKSMQGKATQTLVVVDPDVNVVERVRDRFKAGIPNFATSRVIRIRGDCSDCLPQFLSGELRGAVQTAASGSASMARS